MTKSEEAAVASRNAGNKSYIQKKFFDALIKYNESLCYAAEGSENAGLAYANRSAVFLEVKLYENSLSNIKLAKAHNYPEKNFGILDKREEKCNEMLKKHQKKVPNSLEFFKLSLPSHPQLPFIAKSLELKVNEKYGKHIVTNQSLKVGDVIAVEEPTFRVIKADGRYSTCYDNNKYQRCANCLKENFLDLIPCGSCCSSLYF